MTYVYIYKCNVNDIFWRRIIRKIIDRVSIQTYSFSYVLAMVEIIFRISILYSWPWLKPWSERVDVPFSHFSYFLSRYHFRDDQSWTKNYWFKYIYMLKKKKIRFVTRGFRSLGYSKPYLHFYERIIDRVITNSQRIGTLFVGIFYSFVFYCYP